MAELTEKLLRLHDAAPNRRKALLMDLVDEAEAVEKRDDSRELAEMLLRISDGLEAMLDEHVDDIARAAGVNSNEARQMAVTTPLGSALDELLAMRSTMTDAADVIRGVDEETEKRSTDVTHNTLPASHYDEHGHVKDEDAARKFLKGSGAYGKSETPRKSNPAHLALETIAKNMKGDDTFEAKYAKACELRPDLAAQAIATG